MDRPPRPGHPTLRGATGGTRAIGRRRKEGQLSSSPPSRAAAIVADVALHPLAASFASVADVYERGRPDYAPAVVGALAAELHLRRGARVLDLGAGTGKLTRALCAWGLDVAAVEPQAELREVLAARAGAARVLAGHAEEVPLSDGSVDAVTVADAFHWFDAAAALREIRRVLSAGGALAVIFTVPDWGDAPWAHDLGALLGRLRPEHPGIDGPPWQEAVRKAGDWTEPREIEVVASQLAQPDQLVDYVASVSWIAALPEADRAEALAAASDLLAGESSPVVFRVRALIGLTSPR